MRRRGRKGERKRDEESNDSESKVDECSLLVAEERREGEAGRGEYSHRGAKTSMRKDEAD